MGAKTFLLKSEKTFVKCLFVSSKLVKRLLEYTVDKFYFKEQMLDLQMEPDLRFFEMENFLVINYSR